MKNTNMTNIEVKNFYNTHKKFIALNSAFSLLILANIIISYIIGLIINQPKPFINLLILGVCIQVGINLAFIIPILIAKVLDKMMKDL